MDGEDFNWEIEIKYTSEYLMHSAHEMLNC